MIVDVRMFLENPLGKLTLYQNDRLLDWSKFKAFAYDKIYLISKQKLFLGLVENIFGTGENAGYRHFLLFPQY